ncbi:MAG: hypothetical protein PWR32_773, partial [Candidatus Woesearchaeota archaeon]|nr:hypothetical protein [Candidatus Woesearchaeota archaeon]
NTDLKESNESSYEKTEKIKKPLPKLNPRTEIKKRDKKTALHSLKTLPERIFNLFF